MNKILLIVFVFVVPGLFADVWFPDYSGTLPTPVVKTVEKFLNPIHPEDYLDISSPYGIRENPLTENSGGADITTHTGIDMMGLQYARIVAVGAGRVKIHYPPKGWHKGIYYRGHEAFDGYIVIVHDNGFESYYGHMSSTYIREGQWVRAGQVIGRQGGGGKATGPHLHFALKNEDGEFVQPLRYIKYIWE